jgi:hypothetical protein
MAQTQDGLVSVTNGSNVVDATTPDMDWTDADTALGFGVPVLFSVQGDTEVPYPVSSITLDAVAPPAGPIWHLTLTSNYVGDTNAAAEYTIHTDFTTNLQIPLPSPGDTQTAQIISRAFETLDTAYGNLAFGQQFSSPSGLVYATAKHLGLAAALTPVRSGNIFVMASGSWSNTTATNLTVAMRFGTGTAPVAGAALVGTAFPSGAINTCTAGGWISFGFQAILTGITVGTPYWFDIVYTNPTGTTTGSGILLSAFELP